MENRVRRNTFILYGLWALAIVAIVLAWYFVFLRPQQESRAQVQKDLDTQRSLAARQKDAVNEQRKAEDRLAQLNGQLQFFRKRYRSLYFGELGSDYASETVIQRANRETAWRNWMNTYYSGLGPSLSQELIAVANATGVEINTNVLIEAPPKAPEEVALPPNGLLKPVSSGAAGAAPAAPAAPAAGGAAPAAGAGSINVTVTGTLPDILSYFTRLNTTQTLMTIGAVKLETVSATPTRIRATFSATPYLLASGPGAVPAVSTLLGASAGSAAPIPATTTTVTTAMTTASTSASGAAG